MNTWTFETTKQFVIDWNNGESVKTLAQKYQADEKDIRTRVSILRKRGVDLQRRRIQSAYTDEDIGKLIAVSKGEESYTETHEPKKIKKA